VDPNRIGIWGWSGGSISLNAIFRYPELCHTALAIAFVSNQRFDDTVYQERYVGLPRDNAEGYWNGSPITFALQLKGHLLPVYGTRDDNCHYQDCAALSDELGKHGEPFSLMAYPTLSILFETPPPFGPVHCLNTAGFGPGPALIEVFVPIQRPELLDADRTDGPVEEQRIDEAVVPIEAEVPRLGVDPGPFSVEPGRGAAVERPVQGSDWVVRAVVERPVHHQGRRGVARQPPNNDMP
jgi:hypothetical protein